MYIPQVWSEYPWWKADDKSGQWNDIKDSRDSQKRKILRFKTMAQAKDKVEVMYPSREKFRRVVDENGNVVVSPF